MNNGFYELAKKRRSIRRYTNERISDKALQDILKSALLAPSSFGRHPVEFWVVRDKAALRQIASCKRIGAPTVAAADTAVVVVVDAADCELWIEDGSVASTYVLLAAEEAGVGACWNQIRNRDGKIKSSSDEIKELLGIPKQFEVVSVIALGIPAETVKPRTINDSLLKNVHGLEW